jgi:hypothetical protein
MIKAENGNLEMAGIGKELIKDYITITKGLYRANLLTDEVFCEIGAGISMMNDLGILDQKGQSLAIDLDELKKQMEGNNE